MWRASRANLSGTEHQTGGRSHDRGWHSTYRDCRTRAHGGSRRGPDAGAGERRRHQGGAFTLAEFAGSAAGSWTVPHLHREMEESFYILDGRFTFTVGEERIEAEPGTYLLVPRGTAHTFAAAEGGGRFLCSWFPVDSSACSSNLLNCRPTASPTRLCGRRSPRDTTRFRSSPRAIGDRHDDAPNPEPAIGNCGSDWT